MCRPRTSPALPFEDSCWNFGPESDRDPETALRGPSSELPSGLVLIQADDPTEEIARGFERAGLPPAFVFAFRKTGRVVTEQNAHLLSRKQIAEWDAAIAEFERGERLRLIRMAVGE